MNRFGISQKSFQLLTETFAKFPQIEEVAIFCSRAKGNYKKGSDIDLAIKGRKCSSSYPKQVYKEVSDEHSK